MSVEGGARARAHCSSSSLSTLHAPSTVMFPSETATDGSSWFLKGFYFLISIFHVSFESCTIPFSSEEETLC